MQTIIYAPRKKQIHTHSHVSALALPDTFNTKMKNDKCTHTHTYPKQKIDHKRAQTKL